MRVRVVMIGFCLRVDAKDSMSPNAGAMAANAVHRISDNGFVALRSSTIHSTSCISIDADVHSCESNRVESDGSHASAMDAVFPFRDGLRRSDRRDFRFITERPGTWMSESGMSNVRGISWMDGWDTGVTSETAGRVSRALDQSGRAAWNSSIDPIGLQGAGHRHVTESPTLRMPPRTIRAVRPPCPRMAL